MNVEQEQQIEEEIIVEEEPEYQSFSILDFLNYI